MGSILHTAVHCAVQFRNEGHAAFNLILLGILRERFPDMYYSPLNWKVLLKDFIDRRSPIPIGGLEIKLKHYFRHSTVSLVEQLRGFTSRYEWETDNQLTIAEHDIGDISYSGPHSRH